MRTFHSVALATLAALAAAGCSTAPTTVEWNFGKAVNAAKAAQVIDPDAPSRARAPATTDGQAARFSVERYEKTFQTPPPPVTVLNIGTGTQR